MKKKIILSVLFVLSLSPMLLNQYGGARGVQEISGCINLMNPIALASIFFYYFGVWVDFQQKKVATVLGLVGMIVSEIYEFLTWHIETITGEFSIQTSFNWAFPEFYLGLLVSIGMLVCYLLIEKFEIL